MGAEPQRLMGQHQTLRGPLDNNDFRLSASYASRYNNCHGSANLHLAIPGFEHPERNDNGMKGEGTRLHKIFEEAISSGNDLDMVALLLESIAELWGPKRVKYLQDERGYLIGWFMKYKSAPPLEMSVLRDNLILEKMEPDKDGNLTMRKEYSIAPRRIMFLAEALRYVNNLIQDMDQDTLEILVEEKVTVDWLSTGPKTTVDLIVRDKYRMHVIDLKMGDIEVSPIMNEQLMYYAKTHIKNPHDMFGEDYENITLHIIQRGYTDSWQLPRSVLDAWVEKVQASEQAILAGDLTLSAGAHCKFCPANPHGRGDRGNKACPVMMEVLYGARDSAQSDEDVLEDIDD